MQTHEKTVAKIIDDLAAQQTCGCEKLRDAWEAGARLGYSYGDNYIHFYGAEKERHWRKFLAKASSVGCQQAPASVSRQRPIIEDNNLCHSEKTKPLEEQQDESTPGKSGLVPAGSKSEATDTATTSTYVPSDSHGKQTPTSAGSEEWTIAPNGEHSSSTHYLLIDGKHVGGIREVIERHNAALRRVSAPQSSDKTAESTVGSSTWTSDKELERDNEFYRRGLEDGRKERQAQTSTSVRNAISAAIAPLQAEKDAWQQRAEGMKLGNENYAREVASLQAELEQAAQENQEWAQLGKQQIIKNDQMEARLAIAEANREKMRAEMKHMNDLWEKLHRLLGTRMDADWDNAPLNCLQDCRNSVVEASLTFPNVGTYIAQAEAERDQWKERAEKAESALANERRHIQNQLDDIHDLERDLAEAEEHSPRWIPLTERKPTAEDALDGAVMVLFKNQSWSHHAWSSVTSYPNAMAFLPIPKTSSPVAAPDQQTHPTTGHPAEFSLGWHAALAHARKEQAK